MPVHCGDQMQLGLCLGYAPALACGSCRVSDQGTTLRASDLHNARFLIPLLFVLHKPLDEFPYELFTVDYTVASCKLVRVLFVNDHWWHMWHNRCFDYFCVLLHYLHLSERYPLIYEYLIFRLCYFMAQIVLFFLQSTFVLPFPMDRDVTCSVCGCVGIGG